MKKEDARKWSPSAQEEKRKLAIKLWKQGRLLKEVAELARGYQWYHPLARLGQQA